MDRFTPFAMLVALRPAVGVALILVAVALIAVRRRWWPSAAILVAVALALVVFVVDSRAFASRSTDGPTRSPDSRALSSLSVLSFNVYNGHADIGTLGRTIRAEHPDLVVLLEAGQRYRQRLSSTISDLGYNSWTTGRPGRPDVEGIVVFAAQSLGAVRPQVLDQGEKFRWLQLAGGRLGAVTVLAVHTAAPVPNLVPAWRADLSALHRWCRPVAGPVVLAGDFNATLDHRELRSLGCTDVAAALGHGLIATWPTGLPVWLGVQIDHVLVGADIAPIDLRVLDLPGSDHRAILARLSLPSSNPLGGSK